jgi:ankyrin repeat protein
MNEYIVNKAIHAASKGNMDDIRYIVNNFKLTVDTLNIMMRWGVLQGHKDVVCYMIDRGADIHFNEDESLRYAATDGHLDIVIYLLNQGADVHALNDEALRNACRWGNLDIVKTLISKGANIDAYVDECMKYARRYRHLDVIEYVEALMYSSNINKR